MKTFKSYFIWGLLSFNTFTINAQGIKLQDIDSYIIKYDKINFQFRDSLYHYTIFIEPNGNMRFGEGFDVSSNYFGPDIVRTNVKKGTGARVALIKKSDSILYLKTYFPLLIKNDSSVINHYTSPFEHYTAFYRIPFHEFYYTYILKNMSEPKIFGNDSSISIRVVLPEELYGSPIKYIAIRLDFGKENKLVYSKAKFNSNYNLCLVQKDSCAILQKDIAKLEKLLQSVKFKEKNYFTEIGPYIYPKFLIEYSSKEEYYVLERPYSSRDKKDKDLRDFIYELLVITRKRLKINNYL
jgi:hypothetical protein